jgi:hypothetical protein
MNVRQIFIISSIISTLLIIVISKFLTPVWWLFIIILPLILMGVFDMIQKKHTIRRVGMHHIAKYDEIFPPVKEGCFLSKETIPKEYKRYFTKMASV